MKIRQSMMDLFIISKDCINIFLKLEELSQILIRPIHHLAPDFYNIFKFLFLI